MIDMHFAPELMQLLRDRGARWRSRRRRRRSHTFFRPSSMRRQRPADRRSPRMYSPSFLWFSSSVVAPTIWKMMRDRARLAIIARDGQRNAFAVLIDAKDNELPGFRLAGHERRLDIHHRDGGIQFALFDDFVHVVCLPSFVRFKVAPANLYYIIQFYFLKQNGRTFRLPF